MIHFEKCPKCGSLLFYLVFPDRIYYHCAACWFNINYPSFYKSVDFVPSQLSLFEE